MADEVDLRPGGEQARQTHPIGAVRNYFEAAVVERVRHFVLPPQKSAELVYAQSPHEMGAVSFVWFEGRFDGDVVTGEAHFPAAL